jgi:hypothetical protein
LWADEDYHLAAGLQILYGKLPYRDFWYDKPPLNALVYAAIGAPSGWALRLFDSLYVMAACAALWRFAREMWGEREAFVAAGALAFFLNFYLPAAIIPIAPDFFMLVPHILAVYCAWRGRALAAGLWCGVAFLFNTKGVFVLAICAFLLWRAAPLLALGFVLPALAYTVALRDSIQQVWDWGIAYAKAPLPHPIANAARRLLDWLGFHCALLPGAICFWSRQPTFLALWAAISLASVLLGGRVFPRYFLELLPVMCLAAARGTVMLFDKNRIVIAIIGLAALVPLIRFAPGYFLLAGSRDIALDRDSREAADWINAHKHPNDTLFVWGYRDDIYVYTRLPFGARFGDAQPLTGVPADRHLTDATNIIPEWSARNRMELAATHPSFIVDSLSISNPRLAMDHYPELTPWLRDYNLVHKTTLSLIYARGVNLPVRAGNPRPASSFWAQFTGPGATVDPPSAAHASFTFTTFDPAKVTKVTLPGGSP